MHTEGKVEISKDVEVVSKHESEMQKPKHSLFKRLCLVVTLLLVLVSIAVFIWQYCIPDDIKNGDDGFEQRDEYDLYQLPADTEDVLLSHNITAKKLTDDETRVLSALFDLFDTNTDGKLSAREYEQLVDVTLQPDEQFDEITDSELVLGELVSFLAAYNSVKLFRNDSVITSIFNYSYNDAAS
eukprot:168058_1